MTARRRVPALVFLLAGFLATPVPIFRFPTAVPVERLVKNLAELIEKAPRDHALLYTMARVHYLALANLSFQVPVYESKNAPPHPAPDRIAAGFIQSLRFDEAEKRARKALGIDENTEMSRAQWTAFNEAAEKETAKLEASGWRPREPGMDQLKEHATQSILFFGRAIALAPGNALYHLGRASLAEQCLDLELAGKLPQRRLITGLEKLTYAAVRDQYYATFQLRFVDDASRKALPVDGVAGLVSHEAGKAYLRMCQKSEALGKEQKPRIAEVERGLKQLRSLPWGPITPILVARRANDSLRDLLEPTAAVSFDLDGDGNRETWPWVRPDTGILVWDPQDRREIESGRQLFGSVTFFLFHRDGYAALRLLDDDADGELADLELAGLAIWHDRNGDGRSSDDEVEPVWRAGVEAICTRPRVDADGVLGASAGVRYRDGRVAPTFDWVTRPLLDRSPRER